MWNLIPVGLRMFIPIGVNVNGDHFKRLVDHSGSQAGHASEYIIEITKS